MSRLSFLPQAALAAALLAAAPAWASEREHGHERRSAVPPLPAYQAECGACHVAYPPRLLPADAWQRLMNDLPHHFGTDASLDLPTRNAVSAWLAANAGRGAAPPQDRITLGAWFQREHREVSSATWKRPAVGGAANCSACHTGAAQGDFDEDNVRIPR